MKKTHGKRAAKLDLMKYKWIRNLLKAAGRNPVDLVTMLYNDGLGLSLSSSSGGSMGECVETGGEIEFLEMCEDVFSQTDTDKTTIAHVRWTLAGLLEAVGRLNEAAALLELARGPLFVEDLLDKDEYMKTLSKIYRKTGNKSRAAECMVECNVFLKQRMALAS